MHVDRYYNTFSFFGIVDSSVIHSDLCVGDETFSFFFLKRYRFFFVSITSVSYGTAAWSNIILCTYYLFSVHGIRFKCNRNAIAFKCQTRAPETNLDLDRTRSRGRGHKKVRHPSYGNLCIKIHGHARCTRTIGSFIWTIHTRVYVFAYWRNDFSKIEEHDATSTNFFSNKTVRLRQKNDKKYRWGVWAIRLLGDELIARCAREKLFPLRHSFWDFFKTASDGLT